MSSSKDEIKTLPEFLTTKFDLTTSKFPLKFPCKEMTTEMLYTFFLRVDFEGGYRFFEESMQVKYVCDETPEVTVNQTSPFVWILPRMTDPYSIPINETYFDLFNSSKWNCIFRNLEMLDRGLNPSALAQVEVNSHLKNSVIKINVTDSFDETFYLRASTDMNGFGDLEFVFKTCSVNSFKRAVG